MCPLHCHRKNHEKVVLGKYCDSFPRADPSHALQIENEYGFCGFNDKDYLQNLVDITRASLGKEAVLFTTDPPNVVTMGGLYGDDVIS